LAGSFVGYLKDNLSELYVFQLAVKSGVGVGVVWEIGGVGEE